jgi:hypothetical protein
MSEWYTKPTERAPVEYAALDSIEDGTRTMR